MKSMTVSELSSAFAEKKLSPAEYADYVLKQIDENELNCITAINKEAVIKSAKKSEERYMNGTPLSKIDGIPCGIKDIIDTKDLQTAFGCEAYTNRIPEEDAFVVKKLREAGAVVDIKTNTSQFAMGPTGELGYKGAVLNPNNTDYCAGGSSAGSGAAVAAQILPAAIGTDSGGSIRIPSSVDGIVGMKPTNNLVSCRGVLPVAEAVDCLGPMTKIVTDNAMILNAIAGYNPHDWRSSRNLQEDYTRNIGMSLKGITAVVPDNLFTDTVDEDIRINCYNAVKAFEDAGGKVIRKDFPDVSTYRTAHQLNMMASSAAVHKYDVEHNSKYLYEQVLRRLASGNISSDEAISYELMKHKMADLVHDYMGSADCIIHPTTPVTAAKNGGGEDIFFIDGKETSSFASLGRYTWMANYICFPALSIPCGICHDNLPCGITIMSRPYEEAFIYGIGNNILNNMH